MFFYRLLVRDTGDYEICFDNKFSTMTHKLVFFEVYSDQNDVTFVNSEEQAKKDAEARKDEVADQIIDVTAERMQVRVSEYDLFTMWSTRTTI